MALDEIHRDWDVLGAADPLWAVLTERGRRGPAWTEEEFLATGRAEVAAAFDRLDRLGLPVGTGRALDFGCGAGRLTAALTERFDEVVGVDIAASMLAEARRMDRSGGRAVFLHNTAPDLALLGSDGFDLVYTDRVLQHLTPGLARGYLAELLRVLRPGGVHVAGLPDRATVPLFGAVARTLPHPVLRFVQRRVLGYPAPMRMHAVPAAEVAALVRANGGRLVDTVAYGADPVWHHVRHFVVKGGAADRPRPVGRVRRR
jgi:SAM-dependent methyltransferase